MTDLSSGDALDTALARPEPSADCSLDRLTQALAPLLAEGGGGRKNGGAPVAALLREYAGKESTWKSYVRYDADTYSRNLVWRCGDFELLILCWGEGHASAIHDHAGQQCWMAVLDGELEEVHFSPDENGQLRRGRVKTFEKGSVAFIDDDIALHLIQPRPGTSGVSLHLYSSPIDSCQAFCPETGTPNRVEVSYHSVRGTDCKGTDARRIRAAWGD